MASQKFDGLGIYYRTATFDPASVATVTTSEQDVTVADVLATDHCLAAIPPVALNAGLGVVAARVKSAGVITVRLMNTTAGALDAASGTWTFVLARP